MSVSFESQFCKLIETSADSLFEYEAGPSLPIELEIYRQALLAFYRGDSAELLKLEQSPLLHTPTEQISSGAQISFLIKLRGQLISGNVIRADLQKVETAFSSGSIFLGEGLLIAAAGFEMIDDFASAREKNLLASTELKRIGAFKKSFRALSNAVANLTHLEPDRTLIPECFHLYRRARQLGDSLVAATILMNMSREYQKLGALRIALKYCNRSIALSKDYVHGLIYFLAIAHRAHLLFEMDRHVEANIDFNLAKNATFPQVKVAVEFLSELKGFPSTVIQSGPPASTWEERIEELRDSARAKPAPLGKLEEQFISYISSEPRTKVEICDYLFGSQLDQISAENRLKNIIHRLRKKYGGRIVFENKCYFLAETDEPTKVKQYVL